MSRLKKTAAAAALAVTLIGGWEGLRTTAYRDVVGVPTVCYGETKGVKMGDSYTPAECKAMLVKSLEGYEKQMESALVAPEKLPDEVYVSFLSLTYNIGGGAFKKSSVARYANAGDLTKACNAIRLYNKGRIRGKLQVIKGLDNRRKAEEKLCLEGVEKAKSKWRFW